MFGFSSTVEGDVGASADLQLVDQHSEEQEDHKTPYNRVRLCKIDECKVARTESPRDALDSNNPRALVVEARPIWGERVGGIPAVVRAEGRYLVHNACTSPPKDRQYERQECDHYKNIREEPQLKVAATYFPCPQ